METSGTIAIFLMVINTILLLLVTIFVAFSTILSYYRYMAQKTGKFYTPFFSERLKFLRKGMPESMTEDTNLDVADENIWLSRQ